MWLSQTYRPPDREPKRISDYVAQERKAGRVAFLVAIDENDSFKPLFDGGHYLFRSLRI